MMFRQFKHCCLRVHLLGIVQGLAQVIDGIVIVLSLGFLSSGFTTYMAKVKAMHIIKYKGAVIK